jgi:hypothetical protein
MPAEERAAPVVIDVQITRFRCEFAGNMKLVDVNRPASGRKSGARKKRGEKDYLSSGRMIYHH